MNKLTQFFDKKGSRPRGVGFAFSAAVLVLISGLFLTQFIVGLLGDVAREQHRRTTAAHLSEIRGRLEGEIAATLYLAQGFVSYVATQADAGAEEFHRFAVETMSISRNIRIVAMAPDDVIRFIYPLEGNENVIGLDYKTIKEQWPAIEKAMLLRKPYVAGPVNLVQGGRALIVRAPVFLSENIDDPQSERYYWGLISLVVDSESLFAGAGLREQVGDDLFAVRGVDGKGAEGDVILGDPELFEKDAIFQILKLPLGEWQLAVYPENGWSSNKIEFWVASSVGTGLSFILALLTGLLVMMQQRSRAMSLQDSLTGLANRRLLHIRMEQIASLSDRGGLGFQLFFVDLNGFKPVNDTYGHAVGDLLLQEISRRLLDETRPSDTVARLGGDEFVVVTPGLLQRSVAANMAERLRRRVSEPFHVADKTVRIKASIGWASYPEDASSIDEILVLADKRMYREKTS